MYNYPVKFVKKTAKLSLQKTFIGQRVSTRTLLEFQDIVSAFSRSPISRSKKVYYVQFLKKSLLKNNFENFIKIIAKETPIKQFSNALQSLTVTITHNRKNFNLF